MKPIYQFNSELFKLTGIQRVLLDIHEALKEIGDVRIVGTIPYQNINKNLGIQESDYIRKKNFNIFKNSIVIIHERKFLPIFWILNKFLRWNTQVVYVHHNLMYTQKALSLFPENVVAISDSGIENLTNFFNVNASHIYKIHNCVRYQSSLQKFHHSFDPDNITLLCPARINTTKRQIEIVKRLQGKLNPKIKILFAGDGPLEKEFCQLTKDDNQFIYIGFCKDILKLMGEVDFVFLFSSHEGLPISLIEACANGTPIISNPVGGVPEIIEDGVNGYLPKDWDELLNLLNSLPSKAPDEIRRLGEEGQRIFEERFTFEQFKKKYINLIKPLVDD